MRPQNSSGSGFCTIRLFGAVLKRANGIEALFKQRQADDLKYGGASGALQEFGNLHGDQYSQVRVMHHGGLVPDCRFVSVECGGQHAVALTSDGRVYSWGAGSFGKVFYFSKKLFSKFFFPRSSDPIFSSYFIFKVNLVTINAVHTVFLSL